jgi:hypothetical protein
MIIQMGFSTIKPYEQSILGVEDFRCVELPPTTRCDLLQLWCALASYQYDC